MDAVGGYGFGERRGDHVVLRIRRLLRTRRHDQMTNPLREYDLMLTRRQLFGRAALGLGTAAMVNLLGRRLLADAPEGARQMGCITRRKRNG